MKQDIRNLSLDELKSYLKTKGEGTFRAGQIFEWIYKKNAASFEDMTNLSKEFRSQLA